MMETLNIAFYSDTYLPAVDGVVTSITSMRSELERRGHNVYLFVSGNEHTKRLVSKDPGIFVVPSAKFKKYPQYNIALFPFITYFKFKKIKPDILHTHTPFSMGAYALLLGKLNRMPVVGSFHTLFTEKSVINEYFPASPILKRYAVKYSWKYARYFYNRCDKTIVPSEAIKALVSRKGIRNAVTIPNGIDTKRFNPGVDGSAIREHLLGHSKKKIVFYVGRLSKEKHLDVLIKAIKRLDSDYMLVVGGTGPAMDYYKNLVGRLNMHDRVKFVGFIDDKLLPKYYKAADLLCLPSTFETQGIVSLEAMAVGKPVVGADYLALHEMIKNGKNGEKFKPGDAVSCASKIEKVINNIDAYKETVSTAKMYSVENIASKLIDLYKEMLNNN
ncbi:MAG: glycosyltransferase [Candidatus Micrarchaeia archaeon]